jgi:pyrroline-5-carboxylate reductase
MLSDPTRQTVIMMSSRSNAVSTGSESVAFVGGGNMARSLIGALLRNGTSAASISVAEPDRDIRSRLTTDFGVAAYAQGIDAVEQADIVMLSVKPQVMREVCNTLGPVLAARRPLIISVAAGLRIAQIDAWLGSGFPIVRCMPNTPALIGAGASGLCANAAVDAAGRDRAEAILAGSGLTVWIDHEDLMDTVTGISGSGPAYFFLFIEALEEAGVAQGLPRETARRLAIQTGLGAARMATEDTESPARLRERVTSPNGTTAAALEAFNAGGLRELVATAVDAATRRGRALSQELG